MSEDQIKQAIEKAIDFLSKNPDRARYTDSLATATLESGLRFRITDPDGRSITSDMPTGVGGEGVNPGPGWLMRAGLAACLGSLIAMRAAQTEVRLDKLEVLVDSESDDRGILGMDEMVPARPLSMSIRINIAAKGADEALSRLVKWAELHCPVIDALRQSVTITTGINAA